MVGKKLLVADDSLTIQKVIRLALSHEGYNIQAVSDGVEAVEQLMLFRPEVVLIDVSLPGRSATEVKSYAAENPELRDIRFVVMSSTFEQVDEAAVAQAGFSGRLTKPFDPAHLRKVLIDALAQSSSTTRLPPVLPPSVVKEVIAQPPNFEEIEEPVIEPFEEILQKPESLPIQSSASEADIRQLTESTLKLAGLSDFEWTVNEVAGKEPVIPPSPLEPYLPPLPKMILGEEPSRVPQQDSTIPSPALLEKAPSVEINETSLHALVDQQVEEILTTLSREKIAEIAERVIRKEIDRLLGQGP